MQVLRTQYEKEVAQTHVTTQTKFNYAWGLVKSPIREHQVEGVQLLAGSRFSILDLCFVLTIDCLRHIPLRSYEEARVFVLPSIGALQNG